VVGGIRFLSDLLTVLQITRIEGDHKKWQLYLYTRTHQLQASPRFFFFLSLWGSYYTLAAGSGSLAFLPWVLLLSRILMQHCCKQHGSIVYLAVAVAIWGGWVTGDEAVTFSLVWILASSFSFPCKIKVYHGKKQQQ
jgi:hypothetical protein